MKRTRVLRLVLLGGGLVAMTACGESSPPQANNDQTRRFACEQAKQQNLPNAMEICSQVGTSSGSGTGSRTYHSSSGGWFPWFFGRSYSSSGSTYTGSWFSGRSSSGSASRSSSSSSRGGFGSTASSAGS